MDEKTLVSKMKQYRKLMVQAEELEKEIKAECVKMEASLEIPGLSVKFAAPRRTFNYEKACSGYEIPAKIIKACTKSTVDWRQVAQEAGVTQKDIEATAVSADTPSVSIKITEI